MPIYKRKDTKKLIQEVEKGAVAPVYLLHGERYLCRRVGDELIDALCRERGEDQVNVKRLAGENEDPVHIVNLLKSYSLFTGREIVRVTDSKLLVSRTNSRALWDKALKAYADNNKEEACRCLSRLLDLASLETCAELAELGSDQWQKLFGFSRPADLKWLADISTPARGKASRKEDQDSELVSFLEGGQSRDNILILISEEVDKRKKLYRTIDRQGVIVDLSVPAGENAAARKEKESVVRELISGKMQEMGKKPGAAVVDNMVERVGFHPVAAVLETEKLALFCDDKDIIEVADVEAVISRTREEALYELNEAVADLDPGRSLLIADRLMDRGLHSLAIIAGLRKVFRRFLYLRFLQDQGPIPYSPGQSYNFFQKEYLSRLKESRYAESPFLKGHPYALYKAFGQAEKLSPAFLRHGLKELLKAEYRLKGSGIRDDLVMADFFFSFLTGQEGY